jgi:glutaredoxin
MTKVKIYTTTTCVYCHMLKDYLRDKNIDFEEVVIDEQPDEIQASIDTCGAMGVPCIHITLDNGIEEKILGFNKTKLDEFLETN